MIKNFDSLCRNLNFFGLMSDSKENILFTVFKKSDKKSIAFINTYLQKMTLFLDNIQDGEKFTDFTNEQLDEFNYLVYLTKYFGICQDEIMVFDFLNCYYSRYKFIDIDQCEKPANIIEVKKSDLICLQIDIHEDFSLITTEKTIHNLKMKGLIFQRGNEIFITPKQ